VRFVREGFATVLEPLPPPLVEAGWALWKRLARPNWFLEWMLPCWLGEAFDLPQHLVRALAAANVLGLATVRLTDDLVDGENVSEERGTVALLAVSLHQAWMLSYVDLFDAGSPFWDYLRRYMVQWQRGASPANAPSASDQFPGEPADLTWLADRGAPLKICCAGAGLLAGREGGLADLEAALDEYLVAAVMLDHAQDWQEDLAAVRYNAFVDCYSSHRQTAANREANRQGVLEQLLLGEGGVGYFRLLQERTDRALAWARAAPCEGLEAYLGWFSAHAAAYGAGLATAHRDWLRDKVALVFGPQD
jgi:hypothetical protein